MTNILYDETCWFVRDDSLWADNEVKMKKKVNEFGEDFRSLPKGASKRSNFLHQYLCQLSILSSHEN